jgi:hypothetical protein
MRSTALVTTIVISLALACDRAEDSKKGTATTSVTPKEDKPAIEKAEPAKIVPASQVEPAKAEPAKPAIEKAEPAKAEPAKAGAPPPASAEEAARQVGAWLAAPSKAPTPSFVTATTEVELREFCGACDGNDAKTPMTSKVTGVDAIAKRATELAAAAPAEVLSAEKTIECKKDCCKFVPDDDVGVGDNVVNLESVCLTLDASGKPTGVKRIDVSGSW